MKHTHRHRIRHRTLALATALVLSVGTGCGLRRGFSRLGATEYDFAREYLACSTPAPPPPQQLPHQECKGQGCALVTIDTSVLNRRAPPARVPRNLVFLCMRANGWVLERGGMYRP
jgi:hypothetical protein